MPKKSENPQVILPADLQQHRYLTESEVSAFTKRSLQTLRNERSRGVGIPYVKVGRSIRYPLTKVIEFMEARLIRQEVAQ